MCKMRKKKFFECFEKFCTFVEIFIAMNLENKISRTIEEVFEDVESRHWN